MTEIFSLETRTQLESSNHPIELKTTRRTSNQPKETI